MVKRGFFLFFIILTGLCGAATERRPSDALYSPAAATLLSGIGMDAYSIDPYSARTVEVTMTFLEASLALDAQIGSSWENLLKVSASGMANPKDYSKIVREALRHYVDEKANLSIANQSITYLLQRKNTRMDREVLLANLILLYQNRNPVFASELTTQVSMLELERADIQSAAAHLTAARQMDPYNMMAFSKLAEMNALAGREILPEFLVLQIRLATEINPMNFDVALAYANILRQEQLFEMAQKAYQYSADLYAFLNLGRPMPIEIALPWSLCAFQSERTRGSCIVLADQAQAEGRLDLSLEAVAGLAEIQMGQQEEGHRRLETAARRAAESIKQGGEQSEVLPEQLCWFYSFVLPDPEQALAWGHEAFSIRPEEPETRALFAYALAINGQEELAQEYIQDADKEDPVAKFTRAVILLKKSERLEALPLLKEIIELGPETLIAWRAKDWLKKNDSEYISTATPGKILGALVYSFGSEAAPEFVPVSKLIKAKLSLVGTDCLYGSDLEAHVVIESIGKRNLIISDESMFTGHIRIDAEVRGDIRQSIPALVDMIIRPGRVIESGQHASVPVNLMTGSLRTLLRTYPQASLEVEFTLWLDPVPDDSVGVRNRWENLAPVREKIRRQGVELTRDFLMQRLDGVARGKEGQKYRSAELFTGLLAEQYAAENESLPYRFVRVEPLLLQDAIRRLLADEDWMIRLQTLATLSDVKLPMNYALISSISENLSNERWPVRMMALYVLSRNKSENFDAVLDWYARYDSYPLNRRMAVALGGQPPPAEQSEPETVNEAESSM